MAQSQTSKKRDQDKPAPVAFNFDTYEREGRQDTPFVFVLGGRQYTMTDPQEQDFRDLVNAQRLAELGDFEAAMVLGLAEEDRAPFFKNKLRASALEAMFAKYTEHYGLPPAGEADASSPS